MKLKKTAINFFFINKYKTAIVKYFANLKEEERKKFIGYLYIILTLFTVSFFGLFAIRPTLSTVSNLQKQYEDNSLVLQSLQEKLTALQSLDAQYQNIQGDLELVYAAIPRSNQIPYLTRQVEIIAENNGVTVTKLDFSTVEIYPNQKTVNPIYSFSFNVSVEGAEGNINLFLADLMNFDRIIELDRVITGKTQTNQFGAQITGIAYFSNL